MLKQDLDFWFPASWIEMLCTAAFFNVSRSVQGLEYALDDYRHDIVLTD